MKTRTGVRKGRPFWRSRKDRFEETLWQNANTTRSLGNRMHSKKTVKLLKAVVRMPGVHPPRTTERV